MIKMNKEIAEIKQSLKELHEKIDLLLRNQHKMNNHVDFVEDVYTTVRHPLNYICNKFNGINNQDLPSIEYKEESKTSLEHQIPEE